MRGPDEKVKRRAKERSEGGVWVLGSSVGVPWPSESRLILLFDSEIRMVRTEHASKRSNERATRRTGAARRVDAPEQKHHLGPVRVEAHPPPRAVTRLVELIHAILTPITLEPGTIMASGPSGPSPEGTPYDLPEYTLMPS